MNDPTSQAQDEAIRSRARESFEASVASLDQATGNRLRLMRREALAAPAPARRHWGLPLAAAAIAVLALGLSWRSEAPAPTGRIEAAAATDEASATGFPSEEDADLYAWLGEAPVAPAGGEAL